jgi:tRNA pseudouridine38-40 synthase
LEHYKSIVAYDGTEFLGFQRQSNTSGTRTVQGEIENALKKIGWVDRSIIFAGRTDSGVHASGQVIKFTLDWNHSTLDLQKAVNAYLPEDISFRSVEIAESGFHPRFDAKSRTYQYWMFMDDFREPLKQRFAWRINAEADLPEMHNAAARLTGRHDFRNFGSPMKVGGSTDREVYRSVIEWDSFLVLYTIEANAFLYHMVRRIVRALVDIGIGKTEADELINKLDNDSTSMIGGLAPAKGLRLVGVQY